MFGWLRRRLNREHRKLAYQNFGAASDRELAMSALINGEVDPHPVTDAAMLSAARLINQLAAGDKPSRVELEIALGLNKELRRLFDLGRRPGRLSFDDAYRPLGGWSSYFDCNSNELFLLDGL